MDEEEIDIDALEEDVIEPESVSQGVYILRMEYRTGMTDVELMSVRPSLLGIVGGLSDFIRSELVRADIRLGNLNGGDSITVETFVRERDTYRITVYPEA